MTVLVLSLLGAYHPAMSVFDPPVGEPPGLAEQIPGLLGEPPGLGGEPPPGRGLLGLDLPVGIPSAACVVLDNCPEETGLRIPDLVNVPPGLLPPEHADIVPSVECILLESCPGGADVEEPEGEGPPGVVPPEHESIVPSMACVLLDNCPDETGIRFPGRP